ncbi:MAG: exonuclease domain-containing protein [Planctomycetota bacterium]|nr:WYL domain-containing protein [Planctomycetaceae bacterium]MDQ3330297.1 exonuclease domain-containing protein [Planctomycetota bacterium]
MPDSSDTPLDALDFVAFDTETTGCTAASGRMVEIGAVRFRSDGVELDRFQCLINPLRTIPWAVTRIHGITDAMVRDCPSESDVLPRFLRFLGDPATTVLMAHNAAFDLSFVGAALGRCGIEPPEHDVIDTVRLSRRRAPELPSHSLRSLVRCFGIGSTTDHRGLSDSIDLMRIYLRLIARPPAIETVGELFQFARPSRMKSYLEQSLRRSSRPTLSRGWWRASSLTDDSLPRRERWDRRNAVPQSPPENSSGADDSCEDTVPTESSRIVAQQITALIAAGKSISLVYDGGRNAGQRRNVTPVKLVTVTEVAYLFAYCHLDRKQKQFRLDRIREIVCE